MNCWFTRGYFLNKKDWGLPEPMIQVPWDPQDKSKTPSQVTWTASKAWGFWPLWGPKTTGKLWRVHPPESCETSIKMHTSQHWWPFFYTSQDTMVFLTTCGIRMFPCLMRTENNGGWNVQCFTELISMMIFQVRNIQPILLIYPHSASPQFHFTAMSSHSSDPPNTPIVRSQIMWFHPMHHHGF